MTRREGVCLGELRVNFVSFIRSAPRDSAQDGVYTVTEMTVLRVRWLPPPDVIRGAKS